MTDAVSLEQLPYDHPVVQALVDDVQAEYVVRYGGPDATPVDPAEFAPPDGAFLVARLDGEPVGCIGLRRHDADRAEVKRMFVRQAFRGRGLARLLMRASEEEARRLGYREVVLETGDEQPEAIALYRSSGYRPVPGFGYYRDSPKNRCFAKLLVDVDQVAAP